jgi:gamma-glutamyltranspeptidase/glutathione hydrolase
MMPRRLLGVALLLVAACRVPSVQAAPPSMVAAAHPLAVEAGLEMLRRGGTAVDAAIAVQMVLGVVEPHASGIGGGGFLLHYDGASHAITVYDGRETAPAGASPTMFLSADGKPLGYREAVASGMSVGVPGLLAMLELAHKEKGKLAWSELFGPAIAAARDGFAVSSRLAAWLQRIPALREEQAIRETYFNADGSPRKQGERIANPALAETMDLIAKQGARAMYEGAVAAEMIDRVRSHPRPGTLSASDLADYKPVKREPVCGPYRVWIVCGMPPPSSGGIAILQVLGLIQPFDLQRDAPNDLRAVHLIAEASRLAFADRDRYVADPAFVDVPVAGLLSPAYLAERRKLMSPDRSMGKVGPGVPPGYVERGTSHVSIVDRWGNAVSFTTTIEAPFGAHMMVRALPPEQRTHRLLAPSRTRRQAGGQSRATRQATALLHVADRRARPGRQVGRRAGLGGRGPDHRRHAAGADRSARLGPVRAGRRRPATGDQPERGDRAGGGDADRRPGGRLARAGP